MLEKIILPEDATPKEVAYIEKINELVELVNKFEPLRVGTETDKANIAKRLELVEKALAQVIDEFKHHSHNSLGQTVVPAAR